MVDFPAGLWYYDSINDRRGKVMKKTQNRSRLMLMGSMFIFGTIGIFRRWIPLASSVLAVARGFIGALFLLGVMALKKQKPDATAIRKNLGKLLLSGGAIGVNWILLFEGYRFTSVATATLCYYLAPIFVLLAAPLVLKERLTARKLLCVLAALGGMVLVSGVLQAGFSLAELRGVCLSVGAAVFYAAVIVCNQTIRDISAYDKTVVQLASASLVTLPYALATETMAPGFFTGPVLGLLLVVGILHTGVTYALYFGSMEALPAHTVAIFSYIDPIVAVLLSALLLREPMGPAGWAGAVLILGAAVVSELPEKPSSPR